MRNERQHCDLVVIGGTPGGIACAVRAAREGLSVLLVNRTQHLGGFVTSGAGGWEAPYDGARAPIYDEVLSAISEHYKRTYGENSPQHRASLPDPNSRRHLERPKCEPRVAEQVFEELVEREPNLTVLKSFISTAVERDGALLRAVTLREYQGETTRRVAANAFADCTYEGDFAALAGVPFRVGREARDEYNEPHAGVIFTRPTPREESRLGWPDDAAAGRLNIRYFPHANSEIVMPESTGEADGAVMAYNFRLILTDDPTNQVPTPKPKRSYEPEFLRQMLFRSIVPSLPNRKIAWNGGRPIGPHIAYPEADWEQREKIEQQYLDAMLAALWWAQNDPSAPEDERNFWRQYGLARDEFPDNNNLPYEIYVREARRIVGRTVFTEHDGICAPGSERTPVHTDSIAITDWSLDSVACTDRKLPDSNTEGIFFLSENSCPSQVPYRCLLPQSVDNLLVPVALSASHVGWGCLRLEPVWMQTGEAAGFAAALAQRNNTIPAALTSDLLIRTLCEARFMVSFFNDVDVAGQKEWIPAVQYFGTKEFFTSYDARPHDLLDAETAQCWRAKFHALTGRDAPPLSLDISRSEACHQLYQLL